MKKHSCNNCKKSQVIEGMEPGKYHCIHCGASFTINAETNEQDFNADQLYDQLKDRLSKEYELIPKKKKGEKSADETETKTGDDETPPKSGVDWNE